MIIGDKNTVTVEDIVNQNQKIQNEPKMLNKFEICEKIGILTINSDEPLSELMYIAKRLNEFYNVFKGREEVRFKQLVGEIK